MPTIYLNDTAIEDLGLVLTEGEPSLSGLPRNREIQAWPGRAGGIASAASTVDPRVYRFVLASREISAATRMARLDDLADLLTGTVEIRFADVVDRVARGVARVFETTIPVPPRFVNLDPQITVEIECPIAARWDAQPQSRVLSATPVPIPCGTLPHGGQVVITGAAAGALSTETRLRYRGVSGVLLDELVLLPSLAAGEYLTVNLDLRTITKTTTGGVASDAYSNKISGDFFVVCPRDGHRSLGQWPTLEVTNGVALYHFRRNWVN